MNKICTIPKKKKKQTLHYTKFEHLVRFIFILNFLHHGFFFCIHFLFLLNVQNIYIDTQITFLYQISSNEIR